MPFHLILHICIQITTPGNRVTLIAGSLTIRAVRSVWEASKQLILRTDWFAAVTLHDNSKTWKRTLLSEIYVTVLSGNTTIIEKPNFPNYFKWFEYQCLSPSLTISVFLDIAEISRCFFNSDNAPSCKSLWMSAGQNLRGQIQNFHMLFYFSVFIIYVISDVAVLKRSDSCNWGSLESISINYTFPNWICHMQTETSVDSTMFKLASDLESGPDSTVNELEALSSEKITDFWQEGG